MASRGQHVNAGLFIGEELKQRIPVGIPIVLGNTLLLVGGVVMEEGAKKLHMLRNGYFYLHNPLALIRGINGEIKSSFNSC